MSGLRMLSLFLMDPASSKTSRRREMLETLAQNTLDRYKLAEHSRCIITGDKDLLDINIYNIDAFVIFSHTTQRYAPLIYLAETKKPVMIVCEEDALQNALETLDYLSDHSNVRLVFSPTQLETELDALNRGKLLNKTKVCVFDSGQWQLNGIAWQKNILFQQKFNAQNVDVNDFIEACNRTGKKAAQKLAKRWIKECAVMEPSFEDVAKVARIYLAMKSVIKKMRATAAYVLWCGQFTKALNAKMCFALSKLADDGIPVGCWRGGNLLPMLILHTVSKKPVFTPEAFTYRGKTIALKHCFAPGKMASGKCTLRRWRNMKGTVTGYLQLPKGDVTLINSGIGDKIVIAGGKVVDCKDLGGKNCRITIWVELEHEESVKKLVGREFAMVYGDYSKEADSLAQKIGIEVL